MAIKTPSFYERVAPILLAVVVALAFAVGVLWQKVNSISSGGSVKPTVANNNAGTVPQAPPTGKLTADQAGKLPGVSGEDHILGSSQADIILVEYSDFQCPFCASFHPTAKQALTEYGDKIALVYRHFPLDSIHPQARPAAIASECIAEIGGEDAFWKFADVVFADQTTKLTDLSATAVGLGINKAAFDTCFSTKKTESIVENDYQGGIAAGVTGTPGNFVINKKGEVWLLPGAVPFSTLKTTLDEALSS